MKRWMLSLPKFAKESKTLPSGKRVDERYLGMMKLLRQNTSSYNLLFEKLPQTFGYDEFTPGMCENIQAAKDCFDGMIDRLKQSLSAKVKAVFMPHPSDRADARASLASVIKDWCDSLDQGAFDHLSTWKVTVGLYSHVAGFTQYCCQLPPVVVAVVVIVSNGL